MSWKKQTRPFFTLVMVLAMVPLHVAAQSSSNSYRVEETYFGSGGEVESCSPGQYCAQSSLGSLGVGSASSNNFDVEAGFLTPNEPYLEFFVNATSVNLGTLGTGTTGTGTASFYIRTYLSGNYDILTFGQTLTSGSAQINPMTSTAASTPGTEQFGINLRANTSPVTFGANPTNVPDNTFADGQAAAGYSTVNQYRYVAGETIARSAATANNQAVGRTDYTISYIANVSSITEGGVYTMNQDLVAVPTY